MCNKKTGTSMGGQIEYTRSNKTKKFINNVERVKKQNAKVCLECEHNEEGFCTKYKSWCNKVNHRCNGYDMSYSQHLLTKQQCKPKKKNKRK